MFEILTIILGKYSKGNNAPVNISKILWIVFIIKFTCVLININDERKYPKQEDTNVANNIIKIGLST